MFFLLFQVTPSFNHPEKNEIGGAFIDCWIERPTVEAAIEVAQRFIREMNFVVDEPDEAYEALRENFVGSTGLQYFEQALIDKEVFVVFQGPVVDED